MKRIYLSGPMTGYEKLNFPAFERCATFLRIHGYEVVSPHEIQIEESDNYDACLRADLREMLTCDGVVIMEGWHESRGARLESSVAILVGIPVITYDDALNLEPR